MENKLSKVNEPYNETFLAIQRYWFDSTGKIQLTQDHEKILERWTFADRLIRAEYMHEYDVPAKLMKEFNISRSTAFEDIRNAKRIFGKVTMEEQVYYSSIHYSYALEEFKKAQRRRDVNGAAKFLKLMHEIKTQWDDGMDESMQELAKKIEASQVFVVVDDPTAVGLRQYTDEDKKRLFSELLKNKSEDAEFTDVTP